VAVRYSRGWSMSCRRSSGWVPRCRRVSAVCPWIPHFYLAHGVGTDSAEMPLIGTDLGEQFDERLIMKPG
jgi:hypothetical protein